MSGSRDPENRRTATLLVVAGAVFLAMGALWLGLGGDRGQTSQVTSPEGVKASDAVSDTAPFPPLASEPPAPHTTATAAAPTTISQAPPTSTTTVPRTCEVASAAPREDGSGLPRLVEPAAEDPGALAIAISEALYTCADEVFVAYPAGLSSAAVAAQLAARSKAPLLFYLPGSPSASALTLELERLDPKRVWLMEGMPDDLSPPEAEIVWLPSRSMDIMGWIRDNAPEVEGGFDPISDHRGLYSQVMAGGESDRVIASFWSPAAPAFEMVMGETGVATGSSRLWLIDSEPPAGGLAAAAVASALGERVIYWDPQEVGGWVEAEKVLADHLEGVAEIWLIGEISEPARWLLDATLEGPELPGGGRIMFPHRRLIAFYGATHTSRLGVLGEQDPAATLERLGPFVGEYAADGIMTVPTFEIITTLATASPGRDGDYSEEIPVDTLRPWVDFAGENGVYVVLDLQPGRTDFLTQAMRYEELLKLPHVGLALDPEWRLGPNELHLVRIGSVEIAEANSVVAWLAELVRREKLPQKLLVIHQFRLHMIADREMLVVPPELGVLIQMDGQGSLGAKYNTWGVVVAGTEDREWFWGWKNFFDEDSPMATPSQVLELEPVAYFVSFQ